MTAPEDVKLERPLHWHSLVESSDEPIKAQDESVEIAAGAPEDMEQH